MMSLDDVRKLDARIHEHRTDLATPDGGRVFAEHVRGSLRAEFERRGRVELVAYLLATESPDGLCLAPFSGAGVIGIGPCACHTGKSPEAFGAHIRKMAEAARAVAVLVGFEAWRSSDMTVEAPERDPQRSECVFAALEHLRFAGAEVWTADIRRPAGGPARTEPFVRRKNVTRPASLSNLLPKAMFS